MPKPTILLPLDGSRFGESAVPAAKSLAAKLAAQIELISVFEDTSVLAASDLTAQKFKEWLETYLEDVAKRITEQSGVPTSRTIVDGQPADRLAEYARPTEVDLVVMSTHGRGPLSRAWVGSVADRVVRHVDVPVMLIRADDDTPLDWDTPFDFKRILVALDGSARAEKSLEWSERIAEVSGATLILLQAVEPPVPFSSPYLPHAIEDTQVALGEGRDASVNYLTELKGSLERRGRTVETETLLGAHPASGILRYVDEHPVDLIVVATHGRGGIRRLVLGSVADKILRAARVPLLLVRPSTGKQSDEGATDQDSSREASGIS